MFTSRLDAARYGRPTRSFPLTCDCMTFAQAAITGVKLPENGAAVHAAEHPLRVLDGQERLQSRRSGPVQCLGVTVHPSRELHAETPVEKGDESWPLYSRCPGACDRLNVFQWEWIADSDPRDAGVDQSEAQACESGARRQHRRAT